MNVLKVVFVIIGTLIGAGFASGQEIYAFFYSFGIKGIYGIVNVEASKIRLQKENNVNYISKFANIVLV